MVLKRRTYVKCASGTAHEASRPLADIYCRLTADSQMTARKNVSIRKAETESFAGVDRGLGMATRTAQRTALAHRTPIY